MVTGIKKIQLPNSVINLNTFILVLFKLIVFLIKSSYHSILFVTTNSDTIIKNIVNNAIIMVVFLSFLIIPPLNNYITYAGFFDYYYNLFLLLYNFLVLFIYFIGDKFCII